MNLSKKHCVPCEGIGQPLSKEGAEKLLKELPGWELSADAKNISRQLKLKNFMAAVKLIGRIAEIAEAEDHHPDIHLTGYRNLRVDLSTHALKGLSENDFIVAAKINELPLELKA
jgi:4a-hydroxytetrahydrobiopterin dehydratase